MGGGQKVQEPGGILCLVMMKEIKAKEKASNSKKNLWMISSRNSNERPEVLAQTTSRPPHHTVPDMMHSLLKSSSATSGSRKCKNCMMKYFIGFGVLESDKIFKN